MKVQLHDAWWPRWLRWGPGASGAALLMLGILVGGTAGSTLGLVGAALLTGVGVLLGRRRPRLVEIAPVRGGFALRGNGRFDRVIHTRHITGASAAGTSTGEVVLTLAVGEQEPPLLLELEDPSQLQTLRDAVGIPHHGFGTVSWEVDPPPMEQSFMVVRLLAALAFALGAVTRPFATGTSIPFLYLQVAMAVLPGVLVLQWLMRVTATTTHLTLSPEGIEIRRGAQTGKVPYQALTAVHVDTASLHLATRGAAPLRYPFPTVALGRRGASAKEREVIADQLRSAIARAQGAGPPRPQVGEGLTVLHRGDELPRAWLARIDMAASTLGNSAAYRAQSLDQQDLWRVARDHDADADTRAAALRMLSHVVDPAGRARVEDIVEAVHDDDARRRIRVVLQPDVELAARELEQLELLEQDARDREARAQRSRLPS